MLLFFFRLLPLGVTTEEHCSTCLIWHTPDALPDATSHFIWAWGALRVHCLVQPPQWLGWFPVWELNPGRGGESTGYLAT